MPSTLPPNFLLCAQVDTNICRGTSIDEACMFEESPNSKDELTDRVFLVNVILKLEFEVKKLVDGHSNNPLPGMRLRWGQLSGGVPKIIFFLLFLF